MDFISFRIFPIILQLLELLTNIKRVLEHCQQNQNIDFRIRISKFFLNKQRLDENIFPKEHG